MSSNIILECAERNAVSGGIATNVFGQWSNTFSETIPIEDGDIISMKQALINTRSATTGNLVLEKDTDVIITIGYYEFPMDNTGIAVNKTDFTSDGKITDPSVYRAKVSNQNGDISTNQPYVLCLALGDASSDLVTNDIVFTIRAGAYTPEGIADIITQQMTQDNNFVNVDTDEGTFISTKKLQDVLNGADPVAQEYTLADAYDHVNFLSGESTAEEASTPFTGATQTDMEFMNGRFQFSNLHTPLKTKDASNKYTVVSTSTYNNGDENDPYGVNFVTRLGGVFLNDLQPADFWDTLGFSPSYNTNNLFISKAQILALDASIDDGAGIRDFLELRTTRQNVTNSMFRRTDGPIPTIKTSVAGGIPQFQQYNSSVSTVPLIAGSPFQPEAVGYYLLEAVANFNTEFRNSTERKSAVTAIVSKQYNNSDFITIYDESSIPYVHVGNTTFLSEITLRILDPITGEVVTSLGGANVVFFEINKFKSQQKSLSKK